jgi:hypothetical protein
MAEAGFSGESRYLLAAGAFVCVLGGLGAGWTYDLAALRAPRVAVAAGIVVLALAVAAAVPSARRLGDELAYAADLRSDLRAAVERAGGSERLRSCGPLYAGRYRFPLVAWHMQAHISDLSLAPHAPGVVFRSSLRPDEPTSPAVGAGFELVAHEGSWEVLTACTA